MSKNIKIITDKIVSLPLEFKKADKSIFSLLEESGYFKLYNQIHENEIMDALMKHLDYVDLWVSWSEDKRSSSGWYFNKNETGKSIVGYFPDKDGVIEEEYSDALKACASFIKREIEDIRKISILRSKPNK